MKISAPLFVTGSVLLLAASEFVPLPGVGFIGDAQAIIGMPRTPVSVAGVARRTAVRTTAVVTTEVAVSSAAAASAASAQAAAASSQAAAAQAAAAKPPLRLLPRARVRSPLGTVVGTLPSGCVSAPVSGVEYYLCSGTYYRAAFQGNNLVYVVSKP